MGDAHSDVSKHVKAYLGVFVALAVLTVATVLAAQWDTTPTMGVVVALLIATVKASLVAIIFMHLKWERSLSIWWSLVICAVFFIVLLLVPLLTISDLPPQVEVGTWG
jgi:cytochrome c oxidase subunit 4